MPSGKKNSSLQKLSEQLNGKQQRIQMTFEDFLEQTAKNPYPVFRNIFQLFYDFIHYHIGEGVNEYPDDPETIHYVDYDCSKLFVEGADSPFFADRLFANKLIRLADSLRRGTQQNKIHLFEGPHGSGKSTFLNNMLAKFEDYTHLSEGATYEIIWKIDKSKLGWKPGELENIAKEHQEGVNMQKGHRRGYVPLNFYNSEYLEVPCPSHDNPLTIIPKTHRKEFLDHLIKDNEFKEKLFNTKEYEWVFKEDPCTICTSLYQSLLDKLGSPEEVFEMLFVRRYIFNKRLGEGVSVFNAGDQLHQSNVLTNDVIQFQLAELFEDSNKVQYLFSRFAKTNNGIYSLMDIKDNNTQRLTRLHGIISEGVHKVEDLEEKVNSLFFAVINPEDKRDIQNEKMRAFLDRLDYTRLPYVMEPKTETEIYKSIFGAQIEEYFLPEVLQNFAKIIISSRLNTKSDALNEWIGSPYKYRKYCDDHLLLLKMDLYSGMIPSWISEEDRKKFTARLRKKLILEESEKEGFEGFSGRESIHLFDKFYSEHTKKEKMITMADMTKFFSKKELSDKIPTGFLDSIKNFYDYTVLQQVKESLYYYNEKKVSHDIQNYLFAINFDSEKPEKVKCTYTGENLELTDDFFETIELRILGEGTPFFQRKAFREYTQKEYVSQTLVKEMQVEGKSLTETTLYKNLFDKYVYNLKEKVLDPFKRNTNFRNAVKDYGTKEFNTYDKRIRDDIKYMLKNLQKKFNYTEEGARQVCMYVMDNELMNKFS